MAKQRRTYKGLVLPWIVDERNDPIQFAVQHLGRVERAAKHRLCGICGKPLPNGREIAFIGPDDGRRCFADVWMHRPCAELAMAQCPFLRGRDWKSEWAHADNSVVKVYEGNNALFVALNARVHRDARGAWHFEALGNMRKLAPRATESSHS